MQLLEQQIGASPYAKRQEALREKMAQEKLDAFLVSHFANRRYLSGYTAGDYPPNETAGFLLITTSAAFLITSPLYADGAKTEVVASGYDVIVSQSGQSLALTVAKLIRQVGAKRVGFEAIALVFDHFFEVLQGLEAQAELVHTKGFIETLRLVKDPEELNLLRRAISISDRAFNEVSALVQPGVTEKQIAWELEKRMREYGAECLAFETIVASGPNGSTPHATPSERPFQDGDPVIIDMGARYRGYNSDMTRTLCVGEPTAKFKELYNIVLEAHVKACEAVRPGLTGEQVDSVARELITSCGYGDYFIHSLGHGIGLAVHEPPSLRKASQHVLETGMVHSIEPGIYLAGWGGIRIEDLLLVTAEGNENLTGAIRAEFF